MLEGSQKKQLRTQIKGAFRNKVRDDSGGLDSGDEEEMGMVDAHSTGNSRPPPNRPPLVLPRIDQSESKSANR